MTTQKISTTSGLDVAKLVVSALLVIAGVAGFYVFADYHVVARVAGMLAVVALGVGVVFTTDLGRRTWDFIQESRTEVRKVVWPSIPETRQTTIIVLVLVFICGIMLWLMDMIFQKFIALITG